MAIADLNTHLTTTSSRLYGILDAAQIPDLPMRIFESGLPSHCLLPGDPEPDLAYVAPYLVYLPAGDAFTKWVYDEALGSCWGIFVHSRSSITEMRKHFRGLLSVMSEDGRPLLFRYYDPRVLRKFLPTCNAAELKTFFGRVDTIFAEDESGEKLIRYKLDNAVLKQTSLD